MAAGQNSKRLSHFVMEELPSKAAHGSTSGTTLFRRLVAKNRTGLKKWQSRVSPTDDDSSVPNNVNLDKDLEHYHVTRDEMEALTNDDDPFHRMETLRQMTAALKVKRLIRSKFDATDHYKNGWAGWKQRRKIGWIRFRRGLRELSVQLELWRGSFKTIEGHFGSGVVSYFTFLKWLFLLNLAIFLLLFLFLVVPQIVFPPLGYDDLITGMSNNTDASVNTSFICSVVYDLSVNVSHNDPLQLVLDFLQGTGWMEKTVLFYGYYSDRRLDIVSSFGYNMPLAYLTITVVYFAISLIVMVRYTGKALKEQMVQDEDSSYQYCNKIFGSWDYSILSPDSVTLKHKSMFHEMEGDLDEERHAVRRKKRSGCKTFKVYTIRLIVNVFVLAILAGSGFLIFYATNESTRLNSVIGLNRFLVLLIGYIPSITITVLNVIVPLIFVKIVLLEDFTPDFEVKITLWRTVFLRLASLAVLLGTLYGEITCNIKEPYCNVGTGDCTTLMCWETFVGQQIYKLVIMDFLTTFLTTFFVEFPRTFVVTRCHCKLSTLIGKAEFDIPKSVLDLVYGQTLCWLGAFFSPLIPAICFVKAFLLFYMKKLTCLFNYVPSDRPYRASKTNAFFMSVLIASFVLCCIPVGYVMWKVPPSRGCGPFRIYNYMFDILQITIATYPSWLQGIFNFIASAGFIIPCIIILIVSIYYFHSLSDARNEMVKLLKDQLTLEGKDKQFLLTRINELTGKGPPGRDRFQGKHTRDQPMNGANAVP